MLIISHRSNLYKPDKNRENRPECIKECLDLGLDCEIDCWLIKDKFYLGHDTPIYPVNLEFLSQKGLWAHCKDLSSLYTLLSYPNIICFFHQNDDLTLTSNRLIWHHANTDRSKITNKSVIVLRNYETIIGPVYGICTDYPLEYT